jgi:hypothetical protein
VTRHECSDEADFEGTQGIRTSLFSGWGRMIGVILVLVVFLKNFLVLFAQLFMERQHRQIGLLAC